MNSERILVTGGSGFIGSHIATRLLGQGHHVRVFDNFATSSPANLDHIRADIELIEGDLRDEAAVRAAVQDIDLVYHQGAFVSVPGSIADPVTCMEVNSQGTLNLLMAARDAGVRRLVAASTSAIYGDTQIVPTHENVMPAPLSPYAISKLSSEYLCTMFNRLYEIETVVLRYFNVYGPHQDPSSPYAAVVPKFIQSVQRGEQPVIFGDGEQTRGFVYVDDVVRANLLSAKVASAAGHIINIASDASVSVNEVWGQLKRFSDSALEADYQPARAGDIRYSLADINLAKEVLGWESEVAFAKGLQQTVEAALGKLTGEALNA